MNVELFDPTTGVYAWADQTKTSIELPLCELALETWCWGVFSGTNYCFMYSSTDSTEVSQCLKPRYRDR